MQQLEIQFIVEKNYSFIVLFLNTTNAAQILSKLNVCKGIPIKRSFLSEINKYFCNHKNNVLLDIYIKIYLYEQLNKSFSFILQIICNKLLPAAVCFHPKTFTCFNN